MCVLQGRLPFLESPFRSRSFVEGKGWGAQAWGVEPKGLAWHLLIGGPGLKLKPSLSEWSNQLHISRRMECGRKWKRDMCEVPMSPCCGGAEEAGFRHCEIIGFSSVVRSPYTLGYTAVPD